MKYPIAVLCVYFVLCCLTLPLVTEARHKSDEEWGYSAAVSKKIKKLDSSELEAFPVPVLFGKSVSLIVPDFGAPRGGGTRSHEGQDILAPKGAPIISPTKAVVLSIGEGDSAGKYVRTANPGGLTFVYMHLDTVAKIKSGDVLSIGDLIGTVGDTGNAKGTTPHLHFEVRTRDGAQDPYPFLDDSLTLKEKSGFLAGLLAEAKSKKKMVVFLVEEYGEILAQAVGEGYILPKEIEKMLIKENVIESVAAEMKKSTTIATVPRTLTVPLTLGDEGKDVRLLQQYLIIYGDTKESSALASSGPTGYFGPLTQRALLSLQKRLRVQETGAWDAETRIHLQK